MSSRVRRLRISTGQRSCATRSGKVPLGTARAACTPRRAKPCSRHCRRSVGYHPSTSVSTRDLLMGVVVAPDSVLGTCRRAPAATLPDRDNDRDRDAPPKGCNFGSGSVIALGLYGLPFADVLAYPRPQPEQKSIHATIKSGLIGAWTVPWPLKAHPDPHRRLPSH